MTALADSELRRMQSLRLQMLELHPFWGHLLVQCRLVPAPDLPTFAATDCVRTIWFNPSWTQTLPLPQLGFVLAHEIGHHVFESAARRNGRNPYLWNCATDYTINSMVAALHSDEPRTPLYLPPNGYIRGVGKIAILLDRRFDGTVAEAIYEQLLREAPPSAGNTLVLELPGGGSVRVADHGGGIDIHLPVDLSPQDQAELADRIDAAAHAWRHNARRGHSPGHVSRFLAGDANGRICWQRVLAQFVGQATARADYSRSHPNRRYLLDDIVVPGLWSQGLPEAVVVVDTSGSMSAQVLNQAACEIATLAAMLPEILVLTADAKVHEVVPSRELPAFLAKRRFKGGGGTDHRPVFAWLKEHQHHPELFIGITDLYTTLPERKPGYPVLWVVPARHGDAAFGKVVVVEAVG